MVSIFIDMDIQVIIHSFSNPSKYECLVLEL